jgi:hypothetical protein
MRTRSLLLILLCFVPDANAQSKAPVPAPPELWKEFDPDQGDFKAEIVKTEMQDGITTRDSFISAYVLGESNDHHGGHERGEQTFRLFRPGVPWSFAIQARGHHNTEKLGDDCRLWLEKHVLGKDKASLSFRLYCTEPQKLTLVVNRQYEMDLDITVSDDWQTTVIPADKLIDRQRKQPLPDWSKVTEVQIKPKRGSEITKVIFAQFRWARKEARAP